MNEMSNQYWQTRSNKFFIVWLLLLGGISVIGCGINSGIELVRQVNASLSQFNAQALELEAFRLSFTREVFPVNLGLTFAWLIPPLWMVALHMLENTDLPPKEIRVILMKTIRSSMFFAAPVFIAVGLTTGLTTAFFTAAHGKLSSLFDFNDYFVMFSKSILVISAVFAFSWGETKHFISRKPVWRRVAFCLMHILLGSAAVLAVDYGVSYLAATI